MLIKDNLVKKDNDKDGAHWSAQADCQTCLVYGTRNIFGRSISTQCALASRFTFKFFSEKHFFAMRHQHSNTDRIVSYRISAKHLKKHPRIQRGASSGLTGVCIRLHVHLQRRILTHSSPMTNTDRQISRSEPEYGRHRQSLDHTYQQSMIGCKRGYPARLPASL